MTRIIAVALGCVLLAGGRTAVAEECRGSVTQAEAVAAEDARYKAQMGDDYATLETLLGDDLVYTHSSAAVDTKKSYIEAMRSGAVKYKSMKRSEVTVRTYGCVAVLTGRADFVVSSKGQESPSALRFHSTWVKRSGGLQFVSWQSTRVP